MALKNLPVFVKGEVIKGFGRGSSQLGCPTANFPQDVVKKLPKDLEPGVYYGWASVDDGPVHKMVMNLGWCPFYDNKEKSMETHVIHKFDKDFYGSQLKVCIMGYLRGEMNFNSLEALKEQIRDDIRRSEQILEVPDNLELRTNSFFDKEK